jgi:hypothetical protein
MLKVVMLKVFAQKYKNAQSCFARSRVIIAQSHCSKNYVLKYMCNKCQFPVYDLQYLLLY